MRSSLRAALLCLLTALVSLALASSTPTASGASGASTAATASAAAASAAAASAAAATTTREARMLAKVNAARASHGIPGLRANTYLATYARQHARRMAAREGLFHTASFDLVCCWSAIGENVAWNRTVSRAHTSLMNSPGHRANILNPTYRQVGIGIVKSGGRLWVTQVFRRQG